VHNDAALSLPPSKLRHLPNTRTSVRIVAFRIPQAALDWTNSSFLSSTAILSVTAVPWYLWTYGIDSFQFTVFLVYAIATGLSITLGYHRLFSHLAFKASWPVKFFTLVFGAAAFENHAIAWVSDHRRHHKHVDSDDDPYDISKGFWHAHIGWILFRRNPEPPWDNVPDLWKDSLVVWQQRNYVLIALVASFFVPMGLGYWHGGWEGLLGGLLIGGVARITMVQHCTFLINSLCHYMGNRPYSSQCSARDSWFMALFTYGEGYHNYHHEFQHDYRNGIRWFHWDPTKWTIWILSKLGLASNLRRVGDEKILLAEVSEARLQVSKFLSDGSAKLSDGLKAALQSADAKLQELSGRWAAYTPECTWCNSRRAKKETRKQTRQAHSLAKKVEKELALA
jgi:stearoyl-CoA desaturase (Delta-9 desaturase)